MYKGTIITNEFKGRCSECADTVSLAFLNAGQSWICFNCFLKGRNLAVCQICTTLHNITESKPHWIIWVCSFHYIVFKQHHYFVGI